MSTTAAPVAMANAATVAANTANNNRAQERENLRNIIAQWNANRLDLFEISEPNEDLEFYGVMRFYFQDAGQKVATKCMRISSTASTADVINNLIEKFRPDIRMLSVPEYALYEIHENGDERKLADAEFPLLVQLNWHKDDREGRFLLRRMDEKTYLPGFSSETNNIFNKKLSKREKKEKKKKDKKDKSGSKSGKDGKANKDSLAEKLYTELPETSFTRSISNPEAVMRRRRQQKLEKKLQQFSQEGGPEAGGTLRIFGESINQDVPYKTILLSTRDTAVFAVKEILEKYGKDKEDPLQYCLVQVIVPYVNGDASATNGALNNAQQPQMADANNSAIREYILDDDDCPLIIERSHNKSRGVLTFHIRRRPPDYQPRRRKKKMDTDSMKNSLDEATPACAKMLPYLVEVNPDGSEIFRPGIVAKRHYLNCSILEVGSDLKLSSNVENGKRSMLQLYGPSIQPQHCTIANTDGIIIVTPTSREAETYINGTRIYETTVLKPGMLVRFGKLNTFKFVDESLLKRHSQLSAGPTIGHQSCTFMSEPPLSSPTSSLNPSYETTFDADGKIETAKIDQPNMAMLNTGSLQRHQTMGSLARSSSNSIPPNMAAVNSNSHHHHASTMSRPAQQLVRKGDNILPAILEVGEDDEDSFLATIIKRIDVNQVQFKLCITYSLYMVSRYRASTYFKPEITPEVRAELLIAFCIRYANMIQQAIEENRHNQSALAFWLANSSEILHFLKNDRHLSAFTFDSQEILAEAVQMAFNHLVKCQQNELQDALSSFTTDITDQSSVGMESMTNNILSVLSNSMQLLRRFRVNAALTIQLFSQLFHFINMWLFNKVIGTPENNYCCRVYGIKLKQCLAQIEFWAEKQGLELAAECHLSRIIQTALFLQGSKKSPEDLNALVTNFYKLNSIQLRALCERYQPMSDEMSFTPENIQNLVKMARSTTDELIIKDGREIRLEEENDLQLPFLLPEDGYSCDIVRGIPTGLQEFVQTLVQAGVCSLTIQPTATGFWTIYFINFQAEQTVPYREFDEQMKSQSSPLMTRNVNVAPNQPNGQTAMTAVPKSLPPQMHAGKTMPMPASMNSAYPAYGTVRMMAEPEIQVIKFQKFNNGIGLSIVAARGNNQNQLGIYIKSVVKGGAADLDGRLEAGDQLLKVDGQSLIGITQEKAAELMTQTGPVVTLEVAKQGALYHGLCSILNQQASSSTNMIAKNMNLRPRFVPNNAAEYGAARFNGQYSPMLSQVPVQQTRMPGYNSLPLSLNYNYRNQMGNVNMAAAAAINYNNPVNMRPESQLSYNSQTNLVNSPLVNNSRMNMSTASLPGNASAAHFPNQHAEERHYQNIQMYQLNPATGSNPATTNTSKNANSISTLPKISPNIVAHQNLMPPPGSRWLLHGSHSSLQQPASSIAEQQPALQQAAAVAAAAATGANPSRPVSAIVTSKEQEQIFNNNASNASMKRPNELGPLYSQFGHAPSNVNQSIIDPQLRQQQLMRQEAKMEEIREELRRRDDRLQPNNNNSYYNQAMSRAVSMSNSSITPNVMMSAGASANASTNSLRPRFASQQTINSYNSQSINGFRPNGPMTSAAAAANSLRSGPPPPAPKPLRGPTSQQQQQPATSYRYGPSGYPSSSKSNNSGVSSPSPWEREEKEKEIQQKIEETKRSRDEEIKHLELLPYRNPKNEERLKKLIFEREFQKRAEEHIKDEEEEDTEILDRAEQRERMLNLASDLEKLEVNRQRRQLEQQQQQTAGLTNSSTLKTTTTTGLLDAEHKKDRYDEKSLLKSVDTEIPPSSSSSLNTKSPPLIESPNQRLDRLLLSTTTNKNEPEDGVPCTTSSVRAGVLKNSKDSALCSSEANNTGNKLPKKVSWNDNPSTALLNDEDEDDDDSEEQEDHEEHEEEEPQEDRFSLQDIDDVLGSPGPNGKDWLNNYVSSGSTPGVIGAQEVYNDPRKRIEAERFKSNKNQESQDKLPEKLTFQEKMKMFAKSTGMGDETPVRSKVKISKAQREIEDRDSNTNNNNSNVTNNDS